MTTPTASPSPGGPAPLPPSSRTPIPESRSFRFKNRLLGRPLNTDQLEHERLGKPTALAVFASDNLSSAAYATEEILHTLLIAGIGLVAFQFVMPITFAMIGVLIILVLSYRQTIKAYPSAGGAYIVTKDNLGVLPAQVAGVSLLTDYILVVAVSASAGTAALYSVFSELYPYRIFIALFFIAIVALGNLRGVKESGRIFAVPTYAFVVAMALMIGYGLYKAGFGGGLDQISIEEMNPEQAHEALGVSAVGWFLVLHAFASGGAAVTGVEAISNGVPAFREPSWKNAAQTLVIMGTMLGLMFVGISWLASELHTIPVAGKTVIAQIAEGVYGSSGFGRVMFVFTQFATMFILIMAANTGFADFPRLASFQAEDSFLPRQLTKRGHRLVYSNGILTLAAVAAVLVVILGAEVSRLIPLYAIGVFLSFTLSQAGMARHHIRLKEQGWKTGLLINGIGGIVTAVVTVVISATKFLDGAWVIILMIPIFVWIVVRLNHQYEAEKAELAEDATLAATAPILKRHAVVVLIDKIDRTSARAIQYARTLHPDRLDAVHIAVDEQKAQELSKEWSNLPLKQISLDVRECPDRRINRTVLEVVSELAADGETEVTVLIPRREYRSAWHRLLHDHTADGIAKALADVPHANVTFVPYHLTRTSKGQHIHKVETGSMSGTTGIRH
ncbi:MAG: APC family permease [Actinobacteria bacterium]|nr:APC family permease [Actinomycetota bacterium]